MEASALTTASHSGLLARRSPLLRLQSDEKLVALIRDGHVRAFEVLFDRYQDRLLGFCRHLLHSHAGRRGRATGGLRGGPHGDDRRRAADQGPPVALPDRPQSLPELPEAAGPRGPGLDGRPSARERDDDPRGGAATGGAARDRRRHEGASGDAADRDGPARDRRPLLYGDRPGDGRDAARGEVAAGARENGARRVERGAPAHLRRGAARARRGGRGALQGIRPGPPTRSRLRGVSPLPARAPLELQGDRRVGAVRPAGARQEPVRPEARRRRGRGRSGRRRDHRRLSRGRRGSGRWI